MSTSLPVGTIVSYVGDLNQLSANWLLCDGRPLPSSDYPELSQVLGSTFGTDKFGNSYLPDLRGMFLRGVDGGASIDPDAGTRSPQFTEGQPGNGNSGDAVGSWQSDNLASHAHALGSQNGYYSSGDYSVYLQGTDTANATGATGGSETRPRNVYVYYLILAGA